MTESKYADRLRALGFRKGEWPAEMGAIGSSDRPKVHRKRRVAKDEPVFVMVTGAQIAVTGALDELRQYWQAERIIDLHEELGFTNVDQLEPLH